jgi:outer membrane protein insertion porin family
MSFGRIRSFAGDIKGRGGIWLAAIAVAILLAINVSAVAQELGTIREIRVEGVQRIEPETVRSYLTIRAGDPFDAAKIDDSLKALFATGLFADVSIRRDGEAVVVHVVENPIINRLAFEGNSRIDTKVLEAEVQLKPRMVYTRTRVQTDVRRILDIYRREGRFAATVEPKIIQQPDNRVDLVFEIDEGAPTKISNIAFIGNRRFTDDKLQSLIQSQQTHWYSFLTGDDVYDPDRLQADRELLRRFYLKSGYADFRINSAVAELSPDRKSFFVTFTLEEGPRYKFGEININTSLPDVDVAKLQDALRTSQGDWYNADRVEETVNRLTDAVIAQDHPFVDVRPTVNRDRDNLVINVTYDIVEGQRLFVERIDIRGNTRTQDRVIRRQFRLVEGDAFNNARFNRTRRALQELGYFKKVNVARTEGSAPDQTVIDVDVEEQPTGSLNVGAGYSTSNGIITLLSISEQNLFGRGLQGSISLQLGSEQDQAFLSLTDPAFLDRNMSAGIDVGQTRTDSTRNLTFQEQNSSLTLRTGFNYNDRLTQGFRYFARADEIKSVDVNASPFIQQEVGTRTSSGIGQSITYDVRDSKVDPTDGYSVSLSNDLAGLGGTTHYLRTNVNATTYYPVFEESVLSFGGRVGYIVGIGEDIHLQDRYFLGGDSFRGFAKGGVGPRDVNASSSNSALGGNTLYTATTELSSPLSVAKEFGLRGLIWGQVGSLYGVDVSGPTVKDDNSLRASIGVGLALRTPLGPVRADLGFPVIKKNYDDDEIFSFSLGQRF